MKSWKPEVQTDNTGQWYGNALRFASKEEAEANVQNLASRWMLVHSTRVVESEDRPNYTFNDGVLKHIPQATPYVFYDYTLRAEMVEALQNYVEHHTPLGNFLEAAVSNDFVEACGRADDDNQRNLPALAAYLYNEMPRECWGSRRSYESWIKQRQEAA